MRACEDCGKTRFFRKTGKFATVNGYRVRVNVCRCGHEQNEEPPQYERVKPRVLYFDLETALMKLTNFSLYVPSKRITTDAIIENSFILCWAACFVDEAKDFQYIISDCVRQDEALHNDDKRILQQLFELMDLADYVVGHNSDRFDVKRVNSRFRFHGMPAPFISRQLDTLKMERKYFHEESYRLDYLARKRGGEGKQHMEREDWQKIRMTGDSEALLKMETYCRRDVREGVQVFIEDKQWIESSGRQLVK